MSQHKQSLIRGISLGLMFVGTWGFAIDATRWAILICLIAGSVLVWLIGNKKEKK